MFQRRRSTARSFWFSPQVLLLGLALLALATLGARYPPGDQPHNPPRGLAPQALGIKTFLPVVSNILNPRLGSYVLLGWNDLGMHCYNYSFKDLAVLPPYNTLWAQVIKRGDPPQIVTSGIRVQYSFPDNKTSTGKTDFWNYADQLFGVIPAG